MREALDEVHKPQRELSLRHFTAAVPQARGCASSGDWKLPIKKLEAKLQAKGRKIACFNRSSVLGLIRNKTFGLFALF